MNNLENLNNYVQKTIINILNIEEQNFKNKYSNETTLKELGADSLDILEITIAIEEKFDIDIDETKLLTINDIIKQIKANHNS